MELPIYSGADAIYNAELPIYSGADAIYNAELAIHSGADAIYNAELAIHSGADAIYNAELPIHSGADAIYNAELPIHSAADAIYNAGLPIYNAADPIFSAELLIFRAADAIFASGESTSNTEIRTFVRKSRPSGSQLPISRLRHAKLNQIVLLGIWLFTVYYLLFTISPLASPRPPLRSNEMNEQQLQSLANHLNQSRQEFVTGLQVFADVLKALNDNIKDFRSHLDETLERERETFDDEYLASAGRMVQAQENFTASALAINDVTDALNNRVQHYDDIFNGMIDMIGAHNESAKNILEMFPKFFAAFTETNANTEANNRKLDAFMLKMETYFGSAQGLDYDN